MRAQSSVRIAIPNILMILAPQKISLKESLPVVSVRNQAVIAQSMRLINLPVERMSCMLVAGALATNALIQKHTRIVTRDFLPIMSIIIFLSPYPNAG